MLGCTPRWPTLSQTAGWAWFGFETTSGTMFGSRGWAHTTKWVGFSHLVYISASIYGEPGGWGLWPERIRPGVFREPKGLLACPWGVFGPPWNVPRASGTSFGPRGSSTRAQKCLRDGIWKGFRCILVSFGGQKRAPGRYDGTCDASPGLGSIFVPVSWLWWRCSCSRAFWRRGLGHCNLWDEKHIGHVHTYRVVGHGASYFASNFRIDFAGFCTQK